MISTGMNWLMAEGLLTRWGVLAVLLALLAIAVGIGRLTRKRRR